VFLFADAMFFDMQASEGIPTPETGLPSSQDGQPMIVLWETDINPNQLSMIHENGELIPFQVFQGKDNTDLIQPENTLKPGLCCLTKLGHGGSTESESFWCFQVLPNDP